MIKEAWITHNASNVTLSLKTSLKPHERTNVQTLDYPSRGFSTICLRYIGRDDLLKIKEAIDEELQHEH